MLSRRSPFRGLVSLAAEPPVRLQVDNTSRQHFLPAPSPTSPRVPAASLSSWVEGGEEVVEVVSDGW